jgi:hypothetical protein
MGNFFIGKPSGPASAGLFFPTSHVNFLRFGISDVPGWSWEAAPKRKDYMIADFIRDKLYGRGTSTTGAAGRKRR